MGHGYGRRISEGAEILDQEAACMGDRIPVRQAAQTASSGKAWCATESARGIRLIAAERRLRPLTSTDIRC